MNGSVFPEATLDRARLHWEDYLNVLTPVEERSPGRWYKRDDYFAPLGYGGINGSKLRQCIHMVDAMVNLGPRAGYPPPRGLLTGASVLSPQVSMTALIARHYGLPCTVVLGATKPETCMRHENVAIAVEAGADFRFVPVGFNPALQAKVDELEEELPDWYRIHYGITTPPDALPEEVAVFHAVGARQAENVPDDVGTLVMTAGSCNSCVSVLLGIAQHRPKSLERVVLLGVGPTRLDWIEHRLETIADSVLGVDVGSLFRRRYYHHERTQDDYQTDGELVLEHWDLHATHFATYQDRMPFTLDGIDFHPTYEGKALRYMKQHQAAFHWFWNPEKPVLFWIVGSEPSRRAMQDAFLMDGLGAYA